MLAGRVSAELFATASGICLAFFALPFGLAAEIAQAAPAIARVPGSTSASPPAGAKASPGELLVRFARSANASARARLRECGDTELERGLTLPGLELVSVEGGQSVGAARAALERSSACSTPSRPGAPPVHARPSPANLTVSALSRVRRTLNGASHTLVLMRPSARSFRARAVRQRPHSVPEGPRQGSLGC